MACYYCMHYYWLHTVLCLTFVKEKKLSTFWEEELDGGECKPVKRVQFNQDKSPGCGCW